VVNMKFVQLTNSITPSKLRLHFAARLGSSDIYDIYMFNTNTHLNSYHLTNFKLELTM
jgi:hypothetical protein